MSNALIVVLLLAGGLALMLLGASLMLGGSYRPGLVVALLAFLAWMAALAFAAGRDYQWLKTLWRGGRRR